MLDKMKFFLSEIWVFLQPFIKQMLTDSGKVLARSAMAAVTVVAQGMMGSANEEKRQAAFDLILQDMKVAGVEIGTATINAALEAAVVRYKANN